jgi:L-ascorbate metabolism protein UlaG (beta-lactamase superfamily)
MRRNRCPGLVFRRRGSARWSALRRIAIAAGLATILAAAAPDAQSGLVKVTPLGSHAGELCFRDRALLFEDPTGVRILYDPGFMTDETDPRLGEVHVILLTHAHADHIGLRRDRGGSCAAPAAGGSAAGPTNPNSNVATIAAAKNAAVMTASELAAFLAVKIQAVRGAATPACPTTGLEDETTVPIAAACTAPLGVGGTRTVKRAGASAAVQIAAVQALHPSNIPAGLVDPPGLPPGTTAYAGLAQGFVIRFTNGLTAYLTGDTGMFADMDHVIAKTYAPNLMVINIGPGGNGPTSIGPAEGARIIQEFIRPTTVMPSHVGEQATSGGVLRGGTWTDRFARSAGAFAEVVLPLSDVTLAFDGEGRCVGCRR